MCMEGRDGKGLMFLSPVCLFVPGVNVPVACLLVCLSQGLMFLSPVCLFVCPRG